jgi:hypothetical protein
MVEAPQEVEAAESEGLKALRTLNRFITETRDAQMETGTLDQAQIEKAQEALRTLDALVD